MGHARAEGQAEAAGGTARDLAAQGSELYRTGDFDGATERFRRAYELLPKPPIGVWLARSLQHAGHWLEAAQLYDKIERGMVLPGAPPEYLQAIVEASRERRELLGRMPSVVVLIAGAAADSVLVSLNERSLAAAQLGEKQLVDPGKVLVKGVRGTQTVEVSLELAEGESKEARLSFSAESPPAPVIPRPPPAPLAPVSVSVEPGINRRVFGFIGIGLGGVLLATGGVSGVLAAHDKSALEQGCPERRCPPELHEQNDAYGTKKTISSIGLVGGAAIAAAGAVLVFTASPAKPSRTARQWRGVVTLSGAGLVGAV
jgi:hypothetical protein